MENQGLMQEYSAIEGSVENCKDGAIWRFYADGGVGYIAKVEITYKASHKEVSIPVVSIPVFKKYSVCIPFNAHDLTINLYYDHFGLDNALIAAFKPSEGGIDWTAGGHIHFKGSMLKPKVILTSPVEKTIYPPAS